MLVSAHGLDVWLGFTGLVLTLLILDLGVLNRDSHALTLKQAASWSGGVVGLALLFGLFLWYREGGEHALEYITGYLIELSLSTDNLFVFLIVLQYFAVPAELQPRILKWGILGAIVMRGVMIGTGALLFQRFGWITYLFGAFLIFTGIKMFRTREVHIEPEKNPVVRIARRFLPFTDTWEGPRFLVRGPRSWTGTPLLLVLLVVEWSDLVFAIDSIPAIFAVTRDAFIVYSSNVFAILGLRALFFVLANVMDRFTYLKPGVALILVFVGAKMALGAWIEVPTLVSLGVIVGTLGLAVVVSILKPPPAGAAR